MDWDELKGRLSSFQVHADADADADADAGADADYFQVDKLNYFFTQFFDHNQDGVIDVSFVKINKFDHISNHQTVRF